MRVFGIDPGSERTGYGCVDTDGRRHHLVACGAIVSPARTAFPERLAAIHLHLVRLLADTRPECVVIENLFHAANARSALKLGHARGVAMLAAVQAGVPLVEYTPAEIKRAVVGYGRADKHQIQQMVALLLGLPDVPTPHDAADALAVAICHVHRSGFDAHVAAAPSKLPRSWRNVRVEDISRQQTADGRQRTADSGERTADSTWDGASAPYRRQTRSRHASRPSR